LAAEVEEHGRCHGIDEVILLRDGGLLSGVFFETARFAGWCGEVCLEKEVASEGWRVARNPKRPQGLKPRVGSDIYGTAEAVP
jgi:hypothetical protein